jgi:phytoene dehydrogenase-like protein
VVGSGPNGLSAAIALAQAGASVLVLEGADEIGGGTRTAELTLPGFRHDVCSAVHTTGILSPFFRSLPLEQHGLRWIVPRASVAHPLDDQPAVIMWRSVEETCAGLGADARSYRDLIAPFLDNSGFGGCGQPPRSLIGVSNSRARRLCSPVAQVTPSCRSTSCSRRRSASSFASRATSSPGPWPWEARRRSRARSAVYFVRLEARFARARA